MYAGMHAILIYTASWVPFLGTKKMEFYFLRVVFATVCAICETQLVATVAKSMNPRIALFFLLALGSSAGMFHASVAYLPSTFAMYTVFLALGAFMNRRGGVRTATGLAWLALGALVGWPFVAVMCIPFVLEELITVWVTHEAMATIWQFIYASTRTLLILVCIAFCTTGLLFAHVCQALQLFIDWFFYKFWTCVPLNIVLYNVFAAPGKGPDIYGTEPWHFYIRNLLINFNVWFILALAAGPLVYFQRRYRNQASSRLTFFRNIIFVSPFYLWLAIFTLQSHKEERFMYPVYPCLALNAALSLHICVLYLSSSDPKTIIGRTPNSLKFLAITSLIFSATSLGIWRILGLTTAYSAPLKVYGALDTPGLVHPSTTVCVGKEWYRFPSSYHLPDGAKLKFIRSDFSGLLPGEFSEADIGFGMFPGTWLVPSGMNDRNVEDPAKYFDVGRCDFLVDSYFAGAVESALQPNYINQTHVWERVACEPFLDAARTGTVGRLFWMPDAEFVPESWRRRWGEYCLLRRRT